MPPDDDRIGRNEELVSNKIIAHGRLRHHFWGDYHATIIVKFANADLAARALELPQFIGWKVHQTEPAALVFHGTGKVLKHVQNVLVSLGASRAKMDSVRYSIDFGEPFTIAVSLTPEGPQPVQGALAFDAEDVSTSSVVRLASDCPGGSF